jgi:hypothetical protein
LNGVLFLIPPITFFHIWKHWNKLRKPVKRIIGPAFALALVVLAYAFVPGLSRASRTKGGFEHRLEASLDILKGDVTRQVGQTTSDAQKLKAKVERQLPGELERAKATAQKLGDRAQKEANALKEQLPGKVEQLKKAGEDARDRVEKSVDKIRSSDKSAPDPSATPAPSNPETPKQQGP